MRQEWFGTVLLSYLTAVTCQCSCLLLNNNNNNNNNNINNAILYTDGLYHAKWFSIGHCENITR